MVLDVNTNNLGSSPSNLVAIGSTTYFTANGLWKSDGTAAGTVAVSSVGVPDLINVNGTLFFRHYGGPTASDGSATRPVTTTCARRAGPSRWPPPRGRRWR